MASMFNRLKLALVAFQEAFLTSPVVDDVSWGSQHSRRVRYDISWAMYEQTSYRDVHSWATAYRKKYAMYKYIRPIYNPAYRLGEFWKAHLFGGLLNLEAGEDGAIPIATDSEALRAAIANLWKWSRWSAQKDVLTIKGTILGDTAIQVRDDVQRQRVYLDILHPGMIESVDRDPFGSVKGYVLSEIRDNPVSTGTVTYTEEVTRSGVNVVYKTFNNGTPYAWPENIDRTGTAVETWMEPYTFVPMVVIQHSDVGLEWGWSELHSIRAKVQEVDDVASQLSDQIRRTVDPIWLMKGIQPPTKGYIAMAGATDTADADRPAPGREEMQALWNVPIDGGVEAMVPNLDLESVLAHVEAILAEIERDCPELSQDLHTAAGDASGRALRVARQPVVSKVQQRRTNYDSALVAAQQMAIAIGGWRGYEGYKGFDLDSYSRGDLDHSIMNRPVFEEDPLDTIEMDGAFWKAAEQAVKAGVPVEAFLREAGWGDDRIAALGIEEPKKDNGEDSD